MPECGPGGALPEGAAWGLRMRWFRGAQGRSGAFCSVHQQREATIQCLLCLKRGVPLHLTFHCSPACFQADWARHREMHSAADRAAAAKGAPKGAGAKGGKAGGVKDGAAGGRGGEEAAAQRASVVINGETWVEVGEGRAYTPAAEDVGHALMVAAVVVLPGFPDGVPGTDPVRAFSQRVVPAPQPPPRQMLPLALEGAKGSLAAGKFTLLTYNLLADLYVTPELYRHCPRWALDWAYRREALVREVAARRPDILCLQEVQSDHFMGFLSGEMQRQGYAAVYTKKTGEIFTDEGYCIDGCATFYRRDRFTLVKKYEVEFNKAALSLADTLLGSTEQQRKKALNRLLKDNVALIVVLEALEPPDPAAAAVGKRQLLCVANTHIHANPELQDVKLWQVHTLLKGLEKIAASADIPMLVAGDFNSTPGSASHCLLVDGGIPVDHPELQNDPLGILRPVSKLCHQLPLVSAYTCLASQGPAELTPRATKQKRCIDSRLHEPIFTNRTQDFTGTLDYVFFTSNSLCPSALLELPDEADIMSGKNRSTCMPNAQWPSDHVSLMAEFRFYKL